MVRGLDQVFRRRVFYIPGYDPFPPRRYRELYRREAQAQATLSGYEIALTPGVQPGFGWRVRATQDGRAAETEITVLPWSDIVRASMGQSIAATYGQLVRTFWTYASSGAFRRLVRLRKGPVIAAFYPVVVLTLQALAAIGLGTGLALALAQLASGWTLTLACAAGLVLAILVLRWFRARDARIYAYYLMHDFAFTARHGGATDPALRARLDSFATEVAQALREDWDEVLVVGHSSGAHLAVSVLAQVLRAASCAPIEGSPEAGGLRPPLSFLSLGQVVPMVSFLPRATALRADLRFLSECADLTWVDVTAPGDGCAFALCDPVAVSGAAGPGKRWPLVLSAAFSRTLLPATWAALRRRYFRLHFQYLCAFDNLAGTPGDYDYFRITAGPMTLAERFATRAPSRSRIETSLMDPAP